MAIRDTSAQDIRLDSTAAGASRRRRLVLAAGAGVAVLAALAWTGSGWLAGERSVDAARVRIAEVERGDLVRDIAAEGRVIASNSPSLYAIGAGTVSLHVVAGDTVKRGQLLARIDSPELRSRLAQERATLAGLQADASRAALDVRLTRSTAAKALDQARIEHTAARRELERYQRAFEGGAVAKVDVARAQDAVQNADIGLAHAREDAGLQDSSAALDARNKQALAARQQALVGELERQVAALAILAPFDGQVGQVFVAQHANVQANAPVLSVVDLSRFEVEITVPESFARDLAIGVPAQLTGNNRSFAAHVSAVSPEVVNGEVGARLRFAEGRQPPDLRQSQRLSARILLDTRKDVLMVERGPALDGNTGHAWLLRDGVASRVPVTLGVASLSAIEVRKGLRAGDRVVVAGTEDFAPDERVRIH